MGLVRQNYVLGIQPAWVKSADSMYLIHADILLEHVAKDMGKILGDEHVSGHGLKACLLLVGCGRYAKVLFKRFGEMRVIVETN
jgi:hypothetical protein